jgi:hypothetical protein
MRPLQKGSDVTKLHEAELKLLRAASVTAEPTAKLLLKVARNSPDLSGDTVRYAYWSLVSSGKLLRSTDGVRKG